MNRLAIMARTARRALRERRRLGDQDSADIEFFHDLNRQRRNRNEATR